MGRFFEGKKRRKREEKSGKREEKKREKGRKRDNKVRNVLKREEKYKIEHFSYGFSPLKNFPALRA